MIFRTLLLMKIRLEGALLQNAWLVSRTKKKKLFAKDVPSLPAFASALLNLNAPSQGWVVVWKFFPCFLADAFSAATGRGNFSVFVEALQGSADAPEQKTTDRRLIMARLHRSPASAPCTPGNVPV